MYLANSFCSCIFNDALVYKASLISALQMNTADLGLGVLWVALPFKPTVRGTGWRWESKIRSLLKTNKHTSSQHAVSIKTSRQLQTVLCSKRSSLSSESRRERVKVRGRTTEVWGTLFSSTRPKWSFVTSRQHCKCDNNKFQPEFIHFLSLFSLLLLIDFQRRAHW